MLNGKRLVITGVATEDSIATATARAAVGSGARVALTAFPRDLDAARAIATDLGADVRVHPLDLCDPEATDAVGHAIVDDLGGLDGALHAVAFSPAAALSGDFLAADAAATELAFRTSAWSLTNLARMFREHAGPGGALVGLDFDAGDRAWPVYNWMGVCKAALRSSVTYLARDLGPIGIRVNLVAAGPLHTRAANGIPDFHRLTDAWATTAPLTWSTTDPTPVAETVCFLLSDHSRAITGEVLHVDGGYHAMAAPLPLDGTRVHTTGTSGIS